MLVFTVFTILLVGMGTFMNKAFLEKYYIYKTERSFLQFQKEIEQVYLDSPDEINTLITDIDKNEGVNILILDEKMNVMYSSYFKNRIKDIVVSKKIQNMIKRYYLWQEEGYMYQVLERTNGLPPKIFFTSTLGDDVFLVITKSIKGIRESVAVANEFYLASGFVMIAIGIGGVLFLSHRISDPIIKMNHIARDMSYLEFGEKIDITSNDEIGELAKSINLLSDKLSDSIKSLQDDIEERKVLVRDISHELKTPIAVIKGYVEGLKYNVVEDEQARENYYDVIVEECDRINELIKELLDLSKLEDMSSELQVSQVSIKNLIDNSINKLQHIADMRSVDIRVTCEKDILVHVDEHLMERVIDNLISNAIKYANSQGYVHINLKEKNQGCELRIFNTGNNIPVESLDQIFNVFYKVDQVRGRDNEGHGIGLAIVKRIMEMHKGTYIAENESNGVAFTIWIPDYLQIEKINNIFLVENDTKM